jgi:hypothetical protein
VVVVEVEETISLAHQVVLGVEELMENKQTTLV